MLLNRPPARAAANLPTVPLEAVVLPPSKMEARMELEAWQSISELSLVLPQLPHVFGCNLDQCCGLWMAAHNFMTQVTLLLANVMN